MLAVLRLGERPERDHRINTHLALVARAFGADKLIMFFRDEPLLSSVESVNERFGGHFSIEVRRSGNWRSVLREWKGITVHLSMYGLDLNDGISRLHLDREYQGKDVLVVVGGEKVPAQIYHTADLNVAVGNQPHSEVAALAVFLDRYFRGGRLDAEQAGWKQRIIPQERGKEMITRDTDD